MLSNKDLYSEIEQAESVLGNEEITETQFKKIMIKLGTLNLKLLHNLRANSVTIMKAQGIDLLQPTVKRGEDETQKT